MRKLLISASAFILASCGIPREHFPEDLEIKQTLFSDSTSGLREGCTAIVAEMTAASATRVIRIRNVGGIPEVIPPTGGWKNTPLVKQKTDRMYYEGAFGGCGTGDGRPLGDLPGALDRPGSFYKIINGGEGVAIINPRAKLIGFFYFG